MELEAQIVAAEGGEIELEAQVVAAGVGEIELAAEAVPVAGGGGGGEREEVAAATERTREISVDDVMDRSLGIFQLIHVLLASFAWVFDAQNTLVTMFTDAQPSEWRCRSLENASISSSWCMNNTGSGSKAQPSHVCGLAAGTWEWVGGNTTSTVAEWNLICDHKFLAAIPTSLFFIGTILGCVLYGRLADVRLGREKTLLVACILTSITAFSTSFSPNIWVYTFLRFSNGFARSGVGICCLVLSTETVGRKWRGQVGQLGFFFFTAGFLSLSLINHFTRGHWRYMYRTISLLPLAYTFFLVLFISESPRWLLVRGRNNEALQVLRKLKKGKEIPVDMQLIDPCSATTSTGESLWKTRWAATRMTILMTCGMGIGFVYYGIQLNARNLNFKFSVTVIINGLMDIPAVLIGGLLLSFMNRRHILLLSTISAAISCILCIVLDGKAKADSNWPQLAIEAQSLMFGAALSPVLVVVGHLRPSLSLALFGVVSIVSGALCVDYHPSDVAAGRRMRRPSYAP
ncbi:hypothetical protein V6N13_050095 [Hibiscus sabdariffa]